MKINLNWVLFLVENRPPLKFYFSGGMFYNILLFFTCNHAKTLLCHNLTTVAPSFVNFLAFGYKKDSF